MQVHPILQPPDWRHAAAHYWVQPRTDGWRHKLHPVTGLEGVMAHENSPERRRF
ncbi:hypothetical protein HMPREF0591_0299 [Mycobacterium parascrofulaceum ATCC BAA-614]|uniref:Uncharacterized protein n=1 Tax=Mycobacterium parascrofulaceum ATCC BAA-614 TaxID=525368 RepID=D5P2A5_9MYCO|nr:hypothetical protein HMPREF0591_0299 [Mycobacterium parascrofulaceum ATCC BAA-614]